MLTREPSEAKLEKDAAKRGLSLTRKKRTGVPELLVGLELYIVCFNELVAYRNSDNRINYETLIAYARENGITGEQREDLLLYIPAMFSVYNEHVAKLRERTERREAAKNKTKRKPKKRG